MTTMTTIQTPTCCHCQKGGTLEVPLAECRMWEAGALTQHAFRSLTPAQREQIITGTHPACWDALFAGEEEEDGRKGALARSGDD